jgi:hypothetical protein
MPRPFFRFECGFGNGELRAKLSTLGSTETLSADVGSRAQTRRALTIRRVRRWAGSNSLHQTGKPIYITWHSNKNLVGITIIDIEFATNIDRAILGSSPSASSISVMHVQMPLPALYVPMDLLTAETLGVETD